MRALALSDDDSKMYVGFIHWTTSSAIRKVDVATGGTDVTTTIANSRQPKAMATDDRGNV